ncbi:hypothetical protein FGO68_gene3494 [Halteria grandinella]|uniref:Uncharacterized protein n=1 Tax=Halteria grandinella TaxID=5974 RepID=A0A8J8NVL7_HALGN|nr:hypothetical protein FGO68_gene3494 [Halteria grandinella]
MKTAKYYRENSKKFDQKGKLQANGGAGRISGSHLARVSSLTQLSSQQYQRYSVTGSSSLTPKLNQMRKHMIATGGGLASQNGQAISDFQNAFSQDKRESQQDFTMFSLKTALNRSSHSPIKFNKLGRTLIDSETGLGGSTMEGESKNKSPHGGGGGYQVFHHEESQAGASTDQMQVFVLDGLKNRKWSQLTGANILDQKRDANTFSTPNLPLQDRELITEGEENLSDRDEFAESVKNEAKKLETRISENYTADGPQSNKHTEQQSNRKANQEVHFKSRLQKSKSQRSSSPHNEKSIPQTNKYEVLQQKWQQYMATELYRIQRQLADRQVSPLKRIADQRRFYGKFDEGRSLTPQFKLGMGDKQQQRLSSPNSPARQAFQIRKYNLNSSMVHKMNANPSGQEYLNVSTRSPSPETQGFTIIDEHNSFSKHNKIYHTMRAKDDQQLTLLQEHNKIREMNEREERVTMSMLPNYSKLQNIPFGTNQCESSPKHSLDKRRVASTSKEKFWRDHLATNIQVFTGFRLIEMQDKEREVHHTLKQHYGDKRFSSRVSIKYADQREEVEPYKSRYSVGPEAEFVSQHRIKNFHNTKYILSINE